jgi:hypothetical protein
VNSGNAEMPIPSQAAHVADISARGAEGVTHRQCRKNNLPTSARRKLTFLMMYADLTGNTNRKGRWIKSRRGNRLENGTYKRYSGYDTLNITPSDVFTAAQYPIAQAAVAVSISGLEMLQNSGKEKMIDLLESRINNAERTMRNNMSNDCYSDGTADGGKQIGGLQLLVANVNNSGTVGGKH